MLKERISKIIHRVFVVIQRYCCSIIPTDDYEDGITIIKRSKIVLRFFVIIIVILIMRLLFLTTKDVYRHKVYSSQKTKPFKRLEIVDRNGQLLVNSIAVFDLYLQSSRMDNPPEDIRKINKIIPNAIKDTKAVLEKLKKRKDNNKIVFIKSGLSLRQKQELVDSGVEGLYFEDSEKRFYNNKSTNSITGYCTSYDRCVSGIEKSMNSYLKTRENEPLKLAIDITAQNLLRDILNQRMIETKSNGAVGLIMKIKTGELISAVSLPDCDYNEYSLCSNSALYNRYSLGIYELGSVFKLFLLATALNSGISPYQQFERKEYKIDDQYTIHDINRSEKKGGNMTLVDIIKYSSNVGCAKVMEKIDLKNQIKFLSNLGLLDKIKTEIPEIGIPQFPKKWSFVNATTISYGHGIAVSPLQYVVAIASLLNNSPVRATFLKSNDTTIYDYNYMSDEKYEIFKDIMRQVVSEGAGRKAYIDQYDVGGKTGTAIQYENGKYNRNSMVLSFVSAIPMYNPEYVIFIMLEKPQTDENNSRYITASNILGKTMNYVISTIGPILNLKPIGV